MGWVAQRQKAVSEGLRGAAQPPSNHSIHHGAKAVTRRLHHVAASPWSYCRFVQWRQGCRCRPLGPGPRRRGLSRRLASNDKSLGISGREPLRISHPQSHHRQRDQGAQPVPARQRFSGVASRGERTQARLHLSRGRAPNQSTSRTTTRAVQLPLPR